MATYLTVLRIDPFKKGIALMRLKGKRNFVESFRRIVRSREMGHQMLMGIEEKRVVINGTDYGPTNLHVIGAQPVDKDAPGWRLRGQETITAGYSALYGEVGNQITNVPVTLSWLERNIVWVDAPDTADADSDKPDFIDRMLAEADAAEANQA